MPHTAAPAPAVIGVFDSGIGGLTVVAALRELLPNEHIFYVGDTARVPYGGKSQETVTRYSQEICQFLLAQNCKAIVVACNTASALAVSALRETHSIPILGMIQPGAEAAVRATRNDRIGIIGTRATILSRAYDHAIRLLSPTATIVSHACPVLVPMIEEGWLDDPLTAAAIERYVRPLLDENIDTLVLGCTHYPLLGAAISRIAGPNVHIVDSAQNCAANLRQLLTEKDLVAETNQTGRLQVSLTDNSIAFLPVLERSLRMEVGRPRIIRLGV
ncbi:MAG TPA: glutamate racemase [Chthoniobacterales bacterium]|jgi:glutamate racemase